MKEQKEIKEEDIKKEIKKQKLKEKIFNYFEKGDVLKEIKEVLK